MSDNPMKALMAIEDARVLASARKPRDVFDAVLIAWELLGRDAVGNFVEFTEFARKFYTNNQVIGTDALHHGLALRFQDGTVLPFCDVEGATPTHDSTSIPLNTTARGYDPENRGKTTPSHYWGLSSDAK